MNGIAAIKSYVDRLVTGDGKCRGMKVLLLDGSTTQVVSCATSQTQILARDVFLVSRIDTPKRSTNTQSSTNATSSSSSMEDHYEMAQDGYHDEETKSPSPGTFQKMSHLRAVAYVRPTEASITHLISEISNPRFSEYHLFFSGMLTTGLLRRLAEADEYECVKQVQEFYGDFLPINDDLLTLNCRDTLQMTQSAGTAWARDHVPLYQRNKDGLSSILLALRKQPSAIRYQGSSPLALQLARDLQESISQNQIFHFRGEGPLLLILDRMDDPVTPLLSQWTYQAMVHELLGLNNNRVILKGAPGIKKDLEEVVLSSDDEFFRNNRHANFGELGEAIKKLLDDFQKQTQQNSNVANLNTIEDMQNFMEKFPQIRSQSHTVSKHVALMGELARLVDVCSLMDVSQFEQELACADDHSSHIRELLEKLENPNVQTPDKLRLGLLYALRYEETGNLNRVKSAMSKGGVSNDMVGLVDVMLRYAGNKSRGPGLYGNRDALSKMTKSFLTSVQGVSNVYAQHEPVLMDIVNNIGKGKLKESSHPYVHRGNGFANKPQEVIVFMAGGVTYEEGTKISEFNEAQRKGSGGMQVILAGSTIHNSTSFLEELRNL
eukprot:CAMPEP_0194355998 /NCGR_PEP_ID=MMETSP0174-20130528/3819_1 /TAXON_ID=216777 /ORGANISM="Proboscia alata, Strain PI-D3" /LENGTH=604 /DNA_ID=CAMNT_0039125499 /DNA_START=122 /DNA_END=1936 /DNA_ORIENTATION=-